MIPVSFSFELQLVCSWFKVSSREAGMRGNFESCEQVGLVIQQMYASLFAREYTARLLNSRLFQVFQYVIRTLRDLRANGFVQLENMLMRWVGESVRVYRNERGLVCSTGIVTKTLGDLVACSLYDTIAPFKSKYACSALWE